MEENKKLVDYLQYLSDRDIVILVYSKILKQSIRQIEALRTINRGAIFYSLKKTAKVPMHYKLVKGIQEFFAECDKSE